MKTEKLYKVDYALQAEIKQEHKHLQAFTASEMPCDFFCKLLGNLVFGTVAKALQGDLKASEGVVV